MTDYDVLEYVGNGRLWDKYVWYSKSYDMLVISDRFCRIHTCKNQPAPWEYVHNSFVYIGEI